MQSGVIFPSGAIPPIAAGTSQIRHLVPPSRRRFYFAYGSNLWLQQMATRCPESYFRGRAILPDYRWQINERGFANVLNSSGYAVHGLLYELGRGDEERLDRSEGVSTGAYTKASLGVIFDEAPANLQLPTRQLVEEHWRPRQTTSDATKWQIRADVLVYLSKTYTDPGDPRSEYVDRMNHGIRDALSLGVPLDFFDNAVRPSIPDQPMLRRTSRRVPDRQPGGRQQARSPSRPRHRRRARSASAGVQRPERGRSLARQHHVKDDRIIVDGVYESPWETTSPTLRSNLDYGRTYGWDTGRGLDSRTTRRGVHYFERRT